MLPTDKAIRLDANLCIYRLVDEVVLYALDSKSTYLLSEWLAYAFGALMDALNHSQQISIEIWLNTFQTAYDISTPEAMDLLQQLAELRVVKVVNR